MDFNIAKFRKALETPVDVPAAKWEVTKLRMLAKLSQYDEFNERTQRRVALHRRIAECAENGMVAVIESGRDCDCVAYTGRVHMIAASVQAFDDLYNHTAEWADGQFSFSIMSPLQAEEVKYYSRDLVLEAYENGHPHHIVY